MYQQLPTQMQGTWEKLRKLIIELVLATEWVDSAPTYVHLWLIYTLKEF
jgi:hypothetical protein